MKLLKSIIVSTLTLAVGCTVFLGEPAKRVERFGDWELCTELADKTFKYHSQWHWAITDEIRSRKLDSTEKCKASYLSRMNRFMAKRKINPVSFEDSLNHRFN